MSELTQVLEQARQIVHDVEAIEMAAECLLESNREKERGLKIREDAVSELESAAEVFAAAKKLRDEAAQLHTDLETKKAEIDNYSRGETKKISVERDALLPYQDMKAEVIQDKAKLAEAWAALEKEKAEYEARIRAALVEHFRTGGK